MEEAFAGPRPRLNASLLPKYTEKYVTVVGTVDAGKISPDGNSFVLKDGAGENIQVVLDSPLADIIEGVVEVTGKVDSKCNVHGVMYRVFDSEGKFNMELYNTCVKLIHDFPQYYGQKAS
ncbi:replication protein A 14 kDa subunit-like [Styela clava]|uniref:replication protein A 14 kDa subunit-like n=1 Tax=Styela clava TaxID=7725 RepID=UPI0019395089|nr:replication protein A 14 kDa subunit-like [Styela clava]